MWTCLGGTNQQWRFDPVAAGVGYFENGAYSLVLAAQYDGSRNPFQDGDRVQLWKSNGGYQQLWAY